jgi:hypothetical protein
VISVKYSLDHSVLSIQRTSRTVVFHNRGGCVALRCAEQTAFTHHIATFSRAFFQLLRICLVTSPNTSMIFLSLACADLLLIARTPSCR